MFTLYTTTSYFVNLPLQRTRGGTSEWQTNTQVIIIAVHFNVHIGLPCRDVCVAYEAETARYWKRIYINRTLNVWYFDKDDLFCRFGVIAFLLAMTCFEKARRAWPTNIICLLGFVSLWISFKFFLLQTWMIAICQFLIFTINKVWKEVLVWTN